MANNNDRELAYTLDLICKETSNLSTPYHNFIFNENELYTIKYYENGYGYDMYEAFITQEDIEQPLSNRFIRKIFLNKKESENFIINQTEE